MVVAAQILIKWRKVWYAAEKGFTVMSSKDGKPGIPTETAAEEASGLLYSFVCLYYGAKGFSSFFETWKGVFHSFKIIHWLQLTLSQNGHLAVTAHCTLESASNFGKALWNRLSAAGRICRTAQRSRQPTSSGSQRPEHRAFLQTITNSEEMTANEHICP